MSNTDLYHSDYKRISKTMLTHFVKSRNDYWRYYIQFLEQPPAPKRQMVIGSVVHKVLLERVAVTDAIAAYPNTCFKSNGAINPVPARKFESECAESGKYAMKQSDADLVWQVCGAVYDHELGDLIGNDEAVFETPQYWTDEKTGLDCRLMCDFYLDMGDYILAYDLKTTEDIYPIGVHRTCKTFKYWLQDAHYSSGMETIFGKPVRFKFWFVEVGKPFRIAPYEYIPQARETGRQAYHAMMAQLEECYRTNCWEDPWTQEVNQLNLSPWDVDSYVEEPELVGFDDEE